MTDRVLPSSATPGRRTPTFSAETVPPGLLGEHHTTVWAELVVEAGTVEFHEAGDGWSATGTPERPVVILPERRHHIRPSDDARFHVQFYDVVE